MPIQTIINRSEKEIHSQNKVVKNYVRQLKSAVISSERKKAILKEMQSEMIAESYRRFEKRSACMVKNQTKIIRNYQILLKSAQHMQLYIRLQFSLNCRQQRRYRQGKSLPHL